jgi:DNA (cytosine-5)-methyltransferase 3A
VKFSKYLRSEINEDANGIFEKHHPFAKQLGDVRHIDGYRLRGIVNLLIGGSPCKNFSMAGKRKGMSTKSNVMVTSLDQYLYLKASGFEFEGESYLFWEFIRLLKEIRPKYFLLENVRMKQEWADIITEALGVIPILIDSSVASGQHRERLYWTNIPYTPIEDKGITLDEVVLGAVTGTGKHGRHIPNTNGKNWKVGNFEFNPNKKAYCIATIGGRYRNTQGMTKRFTAENCEALQTLPIGYTGVTGLCKTRRLKAIGNAWTVDVLVEAFFKNLPWANKKKMSLKLKYLNK